MLPENRLGRFPFNNRNETSRTRPLQALTLDVLGSRVQGISLFLGKLQVVSHHLFTKTVIPRSLPLSSYVTEWLAMREVVQELIVGHRIEFSELDIVKEQGRLQSTVLIERLVIYLDLEIIYFEILRSLNF